MQELKVNLPIQYLPGARTIRFRETQSYVMDFSLFRTPEREKQFKWVGPIADEAVYFYKKRGNPLQLRSVEDAKQFTVAVRHQGLVLTELQKQGFTKLELVPNPDGNLQMLSLGRVELSIGETPMGVKYKLKELKLPSDALEQTPVKLLDFPLYIACTMDIPDEVIGRWQVALNKVKASKKYVQIYNKYMAAEN